MSDGFTIEILGTQQFQAAMREFVKRARPEFVEVMNEQAKETAKAIRAAAPVGPSGDLRKAIKVLRAKEERGKTHSVVYISRRHAPHFHLVVFGTSPRFSKWRRARIGGKWVSFKESKNVKGSAKLARKPVSTGKMPPNSFFRQAVESNMPNYVIKLDRATRIVLDDIDRVLSGHAPSRKWKRR